MFAQSVSSFHSPLCWSFQRRFVATENLVTATPAGVNLVSASLPRCPTRITLLTLRDAIIHALYHTNSCLSRVQKRVSPFVLNMAALDLLRNKIVPDYFLASGCALRTNLYLQPRSLDVQWGTI